MKEYSHWPTFPQLYLNGEFIGGLDILREELNDPDFRNKLPKLKVSMYHKYIFETVFPVNLFLFPFSLPKKNNFYNALKSCFRRIMED